MITSPELIIAIVVGLAMFSGFVIRVFRNNWKHPFALLARRVETLETKAQATDNMHTTLKNDMVTQFQTAFKEISQLRIDLAASLKEMEKEYQEAIDDREERLAERINEQSRRLEKLDDHLRDVSKDLVQIARYWNDSQHYRIEK